MASHIFLWIFLFRVRINTLMSVLLPTTNDSQCTRNVFGGCNAPPGYDPNSCETYGAKCYSRTAPQCVPGVDNCYTSLEEAGECVNSNTTQSSLYCRHSQKFPYMCGCVPHDVRAAPKARYALRYMAAPVRYARPCTQYPC